jgi:hypothetical protein
MTADGRLRASLYNKTKLFQNPHRNGASDSELLGLFGCIQNKPAT